MDWLRFPLERELGRVATSSSSSSSSRTSRLLLSSNLRCLARDEFRSIGPVPNELHPNPFPPTYAMRFCPSAGEVLGLANEDGCVALQDTRAGARGDGRELGLMRGFRAHANACFDLAWPRQDAARMVTVSADQTCRAWSLGEGRFRCERIFRGHFRSVKAVEFTPSSRDVFVTASRDNTIRTWDCRTGKSENTISNAHGEPATSTPGAKRAAKRRKSCQEKAPAHTAAVVAGVTATITAISHVDDNRLLSCGDKDGTVKMWDLRRTYSHYKGDPMPANRFRHPGDTGMNGMTSLAVDHPGGGGRFAYASCRDSRVYRWDLVRAEELPDRHYVGCKIGSFFARISLNVDGVLACGSDDTNVYLWDAVGFPDEMEDKTVRPLAALSGHVAEVTCVAWCAAASAPSWRLASCADDDMRHRLWEVNRDDLLAAEDEEGGAGSALKGRAAAREDAAAAVRKARLSYVGGRAWCESRGDGSKCFFDLDGARERTRNLETLLPAAVLASPQKGLKEAESKPGSISTVRDLPCSPRKFSVTPKKRNLPASPRKLTITPSKAKSPWSSPTSTNPTSNLPNFVRDGSSPRTRVQRRTTEDGGSKGKKKSVSSLLLAWLGMPERAAVQKENDGGVANEEKKKKSECARRQKQQQQQQQQRTLTPRRGRKRKKIFD